jgi:hypothetical protein
MKPTGILSDCLKIKFVINMRKKIKNYAIFRLQNNFLEFEF